MIRYDVICRPPCFFLRGVFVFRFHRLSTASLPRSLAFNLSLSLSLSLPFSCRVSDPFASPSQTCVPHDTTSLPLSSTSVYTTCVRRSPLQTRRRGADLFFIEKHRAPPPPPCHQGKVVAVYLKPSEKIISKNCCLNDLTFQVSLCCHTCIIHFYYTRHVYYLSTIHRTGSLPLTSWRA